MACVPVFNLLPVKTTIPCMEIEVEQALQRLANNKELYVQLAMRFPSDVATMMSLFRSHFVAGRVGDAAAVLHMLRAAAGSVGARALADLAAETELQLKRTGATLNDIDAAVAPTLTALERTVAELRQATQSPSTADFDSRALKAMLADLMPLLESRNMRALSVFAKLHYRFSAASPLQSSAHLGALADAMHRLDFATALEHGRLLDAEFE